MIRKDNGAGPILGTSMLTLRLALRHQNLAKGSVLLVCCRGLSPTVREGSVAIRAGALPHGRASAPLVSWQNSLRTLPVILSELYYYVRMPRLNFREGFILQIRASSNHRHC